MRECELVQNLFAEVLSSHAPQHRSTARKSATAAGKNCPDRRTGSSCSVCRLCQCCRRKLSQVRIIGQDLGESDACDVHDRERSFRQTVCTTCDTSSSRSNQIPVCGVMALEDEVVERKSNWLQSGSLSGECQKCLQEVHHVCTTIRQSKKNIACIALDLRNLF